MTHRPWGDDVASIAPDPLDVDDGTGFPEGQNQPEGGPRPGDAGGMWHPGTGGGPADDSPQADAIDWEDRQRPGVAREA